MEHGALADYLREAARAISVSLSDDQVTRFLIYLRELKRWNGVTNLTSVIDDREIIVKHFIDSLAVLKFAIIPSHGSLLDIGAGAGFPSIPLKIVQSDLHPRLLEPNAKKASFLHYLIGVLQIRDISTLSSTIENFSRKCTEKFDCFVVRALRVNLLNPHIPSVLKSTGLGLLYRINALPNKELPEGASIKEEIGYDLPYGYGRRVLTVLSWKN